MVWVVLLQTMTSIRHQWAAFAARPYPRSCLFSRFRRPSKGKPLVSLSMSDYRRPLARSFSWLFRVDFSALSPLVLPTAHPARTLFPHASSSTPIKLGPSQRRHVVSYAKFLALPTVFARFVAPAQTAFRLLQCRDRRTQLELNTTATYP